MNWDTVLISVLSSLVGGVVGATANHLLTRRRELEKRLSELRITHLIECWCKLERGAKTPQTMDKQSRDAAFNGFEEAIARIKLLGTEREVQIATEVTAQLSANNPAAIIQLLNELRDNLRSELSVAPVPKMEDLFFRINRDDR